MTPTATMRVFVTGATGHIGSLVVDELNRAGHTLVGLARTQHSADALHRAGAEAVQGSLDDLPLLASAAGAADGVVHLAFQHGGVSSAAADDLAAVEAIADALAGSDRPFVVTSGTAGLAPGRVLLESDVPDLARVPDRIRSEARAIDDATRGIRTSIVRLAPTVHGPRDVHGFIPQLMRVALDRGVSAWVDDGTQRWATVHESDAAVLFRRALEAAPPGTRLHGVAEDGVPFRRVAEAIGARLGLPTRSVLADDAVDHFGWLGSLVGLDMPASSAATRELVGWRPSHPGLLEDIASVLSPVDAHHGR